MIKHCVQEPSIMGYQHAKKIPVEKFGNPYHVVVEYRKNIKVWPIVRTGDAEDTKDYITSYKSLKV